MATILDLAQKTWRGELPPPPVGRLLGFVLKEVEPGRAVFEMEADERHHNPMGTPARGHLLRPGRRSDGLRHFHVVEESAPNPLDLVAQPLQLGDDALPLVALNFDPPALDRAPGAAPLLEQGCEFPHAVVIER